MSVGLYTRTKVAPNSSVSKPVSRVEYLLCGFLRNRTDTKNKHSSSGDPEEPSSSVEPPMRRLYAAEPASLSSLLFQSSSSVVIS